MHLLSELIEINECAVQLSKEMSQDKSTVLRMLNRMRKHPDESKRLPTKVMGNKIYLFKSWFRDPDNLTKDIPQDDYS